MSEPPSSGFSGVADRANIKELAAGSWQKLTVAFYSGGA
jgi:hypothetical protein